MAAQESSHSVPDAGESQDTSALSPEQKETWLAAFLRGENPEPIEASRPEEPIAEYVGGEIRDCRVSVKWLESDPDYDPEDPTRVTTSTFVSKYGRWTEPKRTRTAGVVTSFTSSVISKVSYRPI
jgi:hypothetical protein